MCGYSYLQAARAPRFTVVVVLATIVTIAAVHLQALHSHSSDFAQLWYGARALVTGDNPYDVVGPDRPFSWPFPLLYPLTAVMTAVPFAAVPLYLANVLWTSVSAILLAWGLTRERVWTPKLWVFASFAYLAASHLAQWSPLLTAAALMPSLGFVLAAKPTVGAALFAAYPNRRAFAGAVVLLFASIVIFPSWPVFWMRSLHSTSHMSAPVTHVAVGGPFILLALIKWKRPEARLLAALACVPQTTLIYEAVPLFLVVERWYEGVALSMFTIVAGVWPVPPQTTAYDMSVWTTGNVMVLALYLPCVAFVLTRRNEHPSWDSFAACWTPFSLRATAERARDSESAGSLA